MSFGFFDLTIKSEFLLKSKKAVIIKIQLDLTYIFYIISIKIVK